MGNKNTNQLDLNIRIIFCIYCFQEEIYEGNELDFETPKKSKSSDNSIFYIKKNVMEKLKDLFGYKTFCNIINDLNFLYALKNNASDFNDCLFYKNAYDTNVVKLLYTLLENNPEYINKIKNLNLDEIIEELKKIDKEDWKYEKEIYQKDNKNEEIKLIKDFEIINEDIYYLLFKKRDIDALMGNYIFGGKKMVILIINEEDVKCLIGNLRRDGTFNYEYLVDLNNIKLAEILMDKLINIGIKRIIEDINGKNKILKEENITIYKIIKNNNIIIYNNNINVINNYIDDNYENIWSEQIKTLILLSLYQKKIHEINEQKLVKVFLVNAICLEIIKFERINDLIKSNNKILNTINNINIKDLTMKFIDEKIINELDENELKYCEQIISGTKEFRENIINILPYEAVSEEIKLFNSKNIKIFKNFLFVPENLLEHFKNNFLVEKVELKFSYIIINKKDILIDHKQSIIYIIKLENKDYSYNIEYILDFKKFDLNIIINDFQFFEYENDIYNKEIDDSPSPIFLKDKIIGNCYKYKSGEKDYNAFIDYSKYFKSKVLII